MISTHHGTIHLPRQPTLITLIVSTACALTGCSEVVSEVTGTVRFQGQALQAGTVTFYHPSQAGRNVVANIRPDGTYTAVNCPRGHSRVTVQVLPTRSKTAPSRRAPAKTPPIPARYTDPETSGLELNIQGDRQTFDIDLTT